MGGNSTWKYVSKAKKRPDWSVSKEWGSTGTCSRAGINPRGVSSISYQGVLHTWMQLRSTLVSIIGYP